MKWPEKSIGLDDITPFQRADLELACIERAINLEHDVWVLNNWVRQPDHQAQLLAALLVFKLSGIAPPIDQAVEQKEAP